MEINGNELKRIIAESGMKHSDVAREIERSNSFISTACGEGKMNKSDVLAIGAVLGINDLAERISPSTETASISDDALSKWDKARTGLPIEKWPPLPKEIEFIRYDNGIVMTTMDFLQSLRGARSYE